MKFAEIVDLYTFMFPEEDKCGRTLLRKVYLEEWRSCLRVRKSSQHTQCKDCNLIVSSVFQKLLHVHTHRSILIN